MISSLTFLLLLSFSYGLNIGCLDNECSKCETGYYSYYSKSCLEICPTNYFTTGSNCVASSSTSLIALDFNSFSTLNTSTIGRFHHPKGGDFIDSQRESPIPTKERGFYFDKTSKLISYDNYTLSPDISISFYIKAFDVGTVFEITDNLTWFKVEVFNDKIGVIWTLSSRYSNETTEGKITIAYTLKTWATFSFHSIQYPTNITFYIGTSPVKSEYKEFRQNYSSIAYIGGVNENSTFKGFFYKFWVDNKYNQYLKIRAYPPTCDLDYYFDDFCKSCDTNCSDWPMCVRSGSCNVCYSVNCSSCTGYLFSQCLSCYPDTGSAPGCVLGLNCIIGSGTFNCSKCSSTDYDIIDGLCLYPPYHYGSDNVTSPVFSIKFNTFEQYYGGIFMTGSNHSTYGLFYDPDSDDPLPAKSRGLFFNGNSYLIAKEDILLNYEFTITICYFSLNYYPLWYRSSVQFSANAFFYIIISNYESSMHYYSKDTTEEKGKWLTITLTVGFINNITTTCIYLSDKQLEIYSIEGSVFYDKPSYTYIGRDDFGKYFNGFIYYIALWHANFLKIGLESFELPTNAIGLWNCTTYEEYYDTYNNVCLYCHENCTSGCTQWATCQMCIYPECEVCDDYYNSCNQTRNDTCLNGYYLTNYHTCCDPLCKNCFGPWYQCLSCFPNYYLLGFHCVTTCPEGFIIENESCIVLNNPFLSLDLNTISNNITEAISNYTFTSGKYIIINPTLDINDPIPMSNRGYYFKPTSYLAGPTFNMSHNFTFVLWVNILNHGILFQKGNISALTNSFQFSPTNISTYSSITLSNWILLKFQLYTNSLFQCIIKVESNIGSYSTMLIANKIFIDTQSTLYIGNSTESFTGFLWLFKIYSNPVDVSKLNLNKCGYSNSNKCIWDSKFYEYQKLNISYNCPASCKNGCYDSNNCVLYENAPCTAYSYYNGNCISCMGGSFTENSQCRCLKGEFFDTKILNCTSCNTNCYDCLSLSICLDCVLDNTYGLTCELCDTTCLTCTGPYKYQCTKCSNYLLNGVCLPDCPLGFIKSENSCLSLYIGSPLMSFIFHSVGINYVDSINSMVAYRVGNNNARRLTENLPFTTYSRGVYFPGESALEVYADKKMFFSSIFAISIWLNPVSTACTLLEKHIDGSTQIKLSLVDSAIVYEVYTSDSSFKLTSNLISMSYWNHILISMDGLYMSIKINKIVNVFHTFIGSVFIDKKNSILSIGSGFNITNTYIGFIYTLEAFTYIPTITDLVKSTCNNCKVCPFAEDCIPNCSETEYYNKTTSKCQNCPDSCPIACKSEVDCLICSDSNCVRCKTFSENTCLECEWGYVFNKSSSTCFDCEKKWYFSDDSKKCEKCPIECLACTNKENCTECIENSRLISGQCICNLGYSLSSICKRNTFYGMVSITTENNLTLTFSQKLEYDIVSTDLILTVKRAEIDFDFRKISDSVYEIIPNIALETKQNTQLLIYIIPNLTSISNSLLSNHSIPILLFATKEMLDYQKLADKITAAKKLGKNGSIASGSVILGFSLLNFDLLSAFNFLNTAEMFYAVNFFNVSLNPILTGFLISTRVQGAMPSAFDRCASSSSGVKMPEEFQAMGFTSNLSLLNAGVHITSFCISLIILVLALILSQFAKFRDKMIRLSNNYRYGVFLRFWLQSYFELLIITSFGIKYNKLENFVQEFDFYLSWFIIGLGFIGLIVFIWCLIKRSCLKEKQDIENFETHFGTFFEEFKSTGPSMWFFYVIFITKRTLLVMCYHFISDLGLQLGISIIGSFCTPLYIITTRCFKSNGYNLFHFVNESINACFYCVLLIGTTKGVDRLSEKNSYICMYLVMAAWGMNIGVSVLTSMINVICKLKVCINMRREKSLAAKTAPDHIINQVHTEKTLPDKVVTEKGIFSGYVLNKRNTTQIENMDWFS
ncbi:hypothetical protein SteCoe_33973 [Stentor coeruleus]|uniref:TNFR-Cys domain-containing protein n=1 Tax=Stentor coeruleus TaxID=5963 RepID=A0A1R2AVR0_9CILI|nr:hypothetical protein SteCoe_33973 [Stentor coeruleus]